MAACDLTDEQIESRLDMLEEMIARAGDDKDDDVANDQRSAGGVHHHQVRTAEWNFQPQLSRDRELLF